MGGHCIRTESLAVFYPLQACVWANINNIHEVHVQPLPLELALAPGAWLGHSKLTLFQVYTGSKPLHAGGRFRIHYSFGRADMQVQKTGCNYCLL